MVDMMVSSMADLTVVSTEWRMVGMKADLLVYSMAEMMD